MVELGNSAASTASGEASVSPAPSVPVKKKRNLPGMPDPNAEVIALSPETLMATNRFVCEICSKGFQRDQNLQLHRRGHNLPWKLRQRASGEIRKRVYVCPEPSCVHHDPARALGDLTGIKKHFCRKHGEKKWKCDRCLKKYAVQSDWKAHLKTCGTREYTCDCGTLFSRRDSFITHRAFCDVLAQESVRDQNKDANLGDTNNPSTVVSSSSTSTSTPPALTPTTTEIYAVPSIKNSELPEKQKQLSREAPPASQTVSSATTSVAPIIRNTDSSHNSSTTSVFASVFAPSTESQVPSASKPPLPSTSFSDFRCGIVPSELPSLSLSSPLYFNNSHYAASPQAPAMSATALLQKAAQIGVASPGVSLLRGLGLALPSSSDQHDSASSTAGLWSGSLIGEHKGLTDLMMGPSSLLGRRSTALDPLGLGLGLASNGPSPDGLSALLTSVGGSLDFPLEGVEDSQGKTWEGVSDRKPNRALL